MSAGLSADVVVVGGGIIGLSVAWRAAGAGLSTVVVDPSPGAATSHVAAGMLAPVSEAHWGEEANVELNLASAARWPSFAAELEAASDLPVGFAAGGTLLVGLDGDDMAAIADLGQLHDALGLATTRLRGPECRREEPLLAPGVRGGVLVPGEHRVDPRAVVAALQVALAQAGGDVRVGAVASVDHDGERVRGVSLASGQAIAAGQVVLAAGAWSTTVGGLPEGARPPVRPVKGQLVVLRAPSHELRLARTVRAWVRGSGVYLVPRDDGRVVVGATQEEQGFDTAVTAGAVHDLLRDAATVVPAVLEHELVEALAGLRPATPDHRPAIGPSDALDGLVLATGHHRNGVLLAPVTADLVVEALVASRPAHPGWDRRGSMPAPDAQPRRFDEAAVQ